MRLRNSLVLLAAGSGLLCAQEARPNIPVRPKPPAAKSEDSERFNPNIRVDTNVVLIPVTVTTPLNQIVNGMEKENFRVFEDKVEQEITSLTSIDAPMTLGLIFDCSGSMGSKLAKSRQAAAQLFKMANPEDEFFLVQFNNRPVLTMGLTRETEELQNRLAFTQAKGRTALLDAIYLGLTELKKGTNPRKALVIISDGGDNSSRYTQTEVRNLLREADAQMYAIGIFESLGARGRSAEELAGPDMLSHLAEMTGGRHFPVENLNDLPDIAAKIAIALRNQYVISYVSRNPARDGKYRRVKVELKQPRGLPPLRAFHRLGYYAPIQ